MILDSSLTPQLSKTLIKLRQEVLYLIKSNGELKSESLSMSIGGNGSLAFSWTGCYPLKELEVWVYDYSEFYAEWLLSHKDSEEEGIARSLTELSEIIKRFYQINTNAL